MSNFTGLITAEFKQVFTDAIGSLLEDTALTVACKLVFDNTKLQECPNCLYDPISRKSSNQFPSSTRQLCSLANSRKPKRLH